MERGRTQPTVSTISPQSLTEKTRAVAVQAGSAWERRLYAGLRVACVPAEVRNALAEALGEAGVDAEFFLLLINGSPGAGPFTHATGQALLRRLEVAGQRLCRTASALELATQAYLTALEAGYPGVRMEGERAETWWPPFEGYMLPGESIELRLRRCGFAYRHVVAVHLASNLESIAEQLALVLHALETLPPAGVMPITMLYQGLYELSSSLQGYTIAHHITDLNQHTPGLLTGIARLRALDAREDTSLAADITWAHAQYTFARSAGRADARGWAAAAAREWQNTIATLEHLQHQARFTPQSL